MNKQRGVSLSGLLVISALVIAVLIIGFKLFPAYTEYLAIKNAISEIAKNPEERGSIGQIQAAYERRSAIEDFKSVRGTDLEIDRPGDQVTIAANWSVKVPLFYNVSACLDFNARSQ
jgi:hypothetical protein